jgi:hypothetical protein
LTDVSVFGYNIENTLNNKAHIYSKYPLYLGLKIMAENLRLEEAERRAWTVYYEDGLWDIFLGLLLLGGGLRSLNGSLWFYLFIVAGVLAFVLGRKFMTIPRVGVIKFGPQREHRRRVLLILLLVSVLLAIALLLPPALGLAAPGAAAGLVLAFAVPLVLVYMAYLLDFRRLYGYAFLVAIFMIITELFSPEAGSWVQVGVGVIVLIVGLWQLISFLRSYPLPVTQEMAGGDYDNQA